MVAKFTFFGPPKTQKMMPHTRFLRWWQNGVLIFCFFLDRHSFRTADFSSIKLEKSQLSARLRNCRLDYSKFRRVKGACDYCHAWKNGGGIQLEHCYAENMKDLESYDPDFFQSWHPHVEALGLDTITWQRRDSEDYCVEMLQFLDKVVFCKYDGMDDDKRSHLEYHVQLFTEELKKNLPEVRAYDFHVAFKLTIDRDWKTDYESLPANWLGFVWDHMASR